MEKRDGVKAHSYIPCSLQTIQTLSFPSGIRSRFPRENGFLSLKALLAAVREFLNSVISRSGLDHYFQRHGVGN